MKQALDKSNIKKLIKSWIIVGIVYGSLIYLFLSFVSKTVGSYQ